MVYKTLVVQADGAPKPFLVMLPSDQQLDLKKLATTAGVKKIRMAAHKDAEALTGLKVGGISGLMLRDKNWTLFLDKAASENGFITEPDCRSNIANRPPTLNIRRLRSDTLVSRTSAASSRRNQPHGPSRISTFSLPSNCGLIPTCASPTLPGHVTAVGIGCPAPC